MSQNSDPAPAFSEQEVTTLVGTSLSLSLRYALTRQYYEGPLDKIVQCVPPAIATGKSAFLRVDQVGRRANLGHRETLAAIHTILSAAHLPEASQFLFMVSGDGLTNEIHFGARSLDSAKWPVENLRKMLANSIRANLPGTRTTPRNTALLEQKIAEDFHHWTSLTGVPSVKFDGREGSPLALDRFMSAMKGQPYAYLVIADPMPPSEIDHAIFACREMMSQAESLKELTATDSWSRSTADSFQRAVTTGVSHGVTDTRNRSASTLGGGAIVGKIGVGALAIGAAVLTPLFPPASLGLALAFAGVGGLAALGSMCLPQSRQTGGSRSFSESTQETDGYTIGRSITTGFSNSLGRKIINGHVAGVLQYLEHTIRRLEQQRAAGSWNTSVYLLAESANSGKLGGQQLCALLNGADSYVEPMRAHSMDGIISDGSWDALGRFQRPRFKIVSSQGDEIGHPLGAPFGDVTTPLSTQELALLAYLPERGIAGVPVLEVASSSATPPKVDNTKSLPLGNILSFGEESGLEYRLGLDSLCKHTLVAGINGSGKSTTIRHLLAELQRQAEAIPFLVIEPAKEEYLAWAMDFNSKLSRDDPRRIAIYVPGAKTWNGHAISERLELNPLQILRLPGGAEPNVAGHIDRLKSILISAFPAEDVLPVVLEELIYYVYQLPAANWLGDELPPDEARFPSLTAMFENRDKVIDRGYEPRIRGNISAAIRTRLQNLRHGWKKELFDPASGRSTDWQKLFGRPVVINLSWLEYDLDKCLAMSVLLMFLFEYRKMSHRVNPTSVNASAPLQHFTVIEEAHRIMKNDAAARHGQANSQNRVAEMFANMLSEIRAYGEGFLIADQVPGRLIPDAVKNTNLKIVHRLVASDDREAMAGCMTMSKEQMDMLTRLRPGQAFVFGDQDDMPAWIAVAGNPGRPETSAALDQNNLPAKGGKKSRVDEFLSQRK